MEDFDAEGEREARVFTLWLNSLDVQPAVNSLFDDLRDGSILLQAYDKVIPGSVNWRHVNKPPPTGGELMRFKAVENTNYAIELGKQMRFSLVGVQGADITDGQRTLTLGLVWQLMRRDISETLSALAQRLGKREITDAEMIKWANEQSQKGGRNSSIRSFKDQAIGSGTFLLDVLNGMKSSYVDYELVTAGHTDEEAYANAKLSISIARKMGATIWLVPEDICQVRSRLVVTFIGTFLCCAVSGSTPAFVPTLNRESLTNGHHRFLDGYFRENVVYSFYGGNALPISQAFMLSKFLLYAIPSNRCTCRSREAYSRLGKCFVIAIPSSCSSSPMFPLKSSLNHPSPFPRLSSPHPYPTPPLPLYSLISRKSLVSYPISEMDKSGCI